MGGRKKPTISQLEKRARRKMVQEKKEERKRYTMTLTSQGKLAEGSYDQIISEIRKMKYLTPYIIANRFGLKISRAKRVLRELESRGIIKIYDKNRRVPIYVPAS